MNKSNTFVKEVKKRSTSLYNKNGFIERLMMPLVELIPHDASAVTESEEVGFSMHGINYGFPQEFLVEWMNQDIKSIKRWDEYFKTGPERGYATIQTSEFPKSSEVRKELELLHGKHGFHSSILTMFFSSTGKIQGIYALSRKTDMPFTAEEKALFDKVAPYIFYAFRKYKKLLDINFYSSQNLDRQVFGIVIADNNRIINWNNDIAGKLLKNKYGKMPKRLPECLEEAVEKLIDLSSGKKELSLAYREATHTCSYGQINCFRYDIFGSMFLPVSGEGIVFIINTKHLEGTLLAPLSRREIDVLRLLAEGFSDKEISSRLNISEKTVQTYMRKLFTKLNVSNRTSAAVEAVKLNVI